MMTPVTLSAEEFTQLHNAVCDLRNLQDNLESVIHHKLSGEFSTSMENIDRALAGAYMQDHEAGHRKSAHYSDMIDKFGERLTDSIWSMFEVDNMMDSHPWAGATHVAYESRWGNTPQPVAIDGPLWIDLWLAANTAIKQSGNEHHIFIEGFTPSLVDPQTLVLSTGS